MVSHGGVYSYLQAVVPELRGAGREVGLLWSERVADGRLEADWQRQLDDPVGLRARHRQLVQEMIRATHEWRPQVVLTVLPQSDLAAARARDQLEARWVPMIHGRPYPVGGEAPALKAAAWRAAMVWAYRRADRLLAVSEALAAELERQLHVRDPITVVHNGVALPADGELATRESDPVVGFVGRLSHEKAPDLFVDVASHLEARALVFGDGPLRTAVGAAAAAAGNVELRGWTDRDTAFSEIDVVAMTSRREGLPLVALEAGARGRCVVARGVGGVPEVFQRDAALAERCLLPADATADDFAAAVRPLLDRPELRHEMGARLRGVVERDFSLDAHVRNLLIALDGQAVG